MPSTDDDVAVDWRISTRISDSKGERPTLLVFAPGILAAFTWTAGMLLATPRLLPALTSLALVCGVPTIWLWRLTSKPPTKPGNGMQILAFAAGNLLVSLWAIACLAQSSTPTPKLALVAAISRIDPSQALAYCLCILVALWSTVFLAWESTPTPYVKKDKVPVAGLVTREPKKKQAAAFDLAKEVHNQQLEENNRLATRSLGVLSFAGLLVGLLVNAIRPILAETTSQQYTTLLSVPALAAGVALVLLGSACVSALTSISVNYKPFRYPQVEKDLIDENPSDAPGFKSVADYYAAYQVQEGKGTFSPSLVMTAVAIGNRRAVYYSHAANQATLAVTLLIVCAIDLGAIALLAEG